MVTEKLDYKKLGMKCGLEIHQQLNTHKLFCNCPSIIRDDDPDVIIERKLKAVVGETGEIDSAAAHESLRSKKIIYHGYSDTTCPIEFDEEPPRIMDQDALKVVLQVSKILDSEIVDEIQVMRKTVVDGSNTTGFQRTALVGRNGTLKTVSGNIGIPTIIIEEDAGKIVEQDPDKSVYNLSRLGIPLIEIGTDPDIKTPKEAHDVALRIGMILRSTGKVKRGLGTIRQDLNVSITGGNRVEIKGAQDLKMIETWVEQEVIRQKNLLDLKDDLSKNKASVLKTKHDISNIFEKTNCKIISSGLKKKGIVKAVKFKGFEGLLGFEIQTNKRVGTELSDYAKRKSGVKGLFHSDEKLSKYSISEAELKKIKNSLKLAKGDSFILIADDPLKVEIALDAVIERAEQLFKGIPKEVRRANPDGSSTFMRPMPGAARMYPETDCVPIRTSYLIGNIEIPEMIEDKEKRFQNQYKLSSEMARQAARFDYSLVSLDDNIVSFDDLVKIFPEIKPIFLAEAIISTPKELKKRFGIESEEIYQHIFVLLEKLVKNEITKDAFLDILSELAKGKSVDFSKYKPISREDIENKIIDIAEKNKSASFGALMGKAMAEFKGKVDGKVVSEIIRKIKDQ
ncbi:MAG: Glu-tRNA(Gln) amidotransferase subunit GatE [Candidatus Woesearchaeota archaeon]